MEFRVHTAQMDFIVSVRSNDRVQSSRRGSTHGFHNQGEEQRWSPELTPREHKWIS